MKNIKMADFGKDHWSLLGYIETLCVDSGNSAGVGTIDYRRVRVNEKTHPLLAINFRQTNTPWNNEYGTRLRGFWKKDKSTDPGRRLPSHDDIDCLDDLETEGLVVINSLVNGFVTLTDKGILIAAKIREHKAHGGYFGTFSIEPAAITAR